jgi:hypothetical protein
MYGFLLDPIAELLAVREWRARMIAGGPRSSDFLRQLDLVRATGSTNGFLAAYSFVDQV